MYIKRALEDVLKKQLFKGKVIVLYGPRQAGKTTLVKQVLKDMREPVRFVDCELLSNNELLTRRNTEEIFSFVQGYHVVVFDEAQTVKGICSVLKSLIDHHPETQYIATGSSSFDLINEVSEPLTGRSREYVLYPLSLTELADRPFDAENRLGEFMRFGGYPGIQAMTEDEKTQDLQTLVSQYLYKNVLSLDGLRKPELVSSLLKLLAFQIGHEVSYRELAQTLGTSIATVQKYIGLLEQNFVLLRIGAYARVGRKEVVRSKKIYFIDPGLRNALVNNFAPMHITTRPDVGVLFENTMIVERFKHIVHHGHVPPKQFFWRTVDQQEVDYLEEQDWGIKASEFKWGRTTAPPPKVFLKHYPEASFETVNQGNAYAFLTQL